MYIDMIKDWIKAFRLRTLPLAFACVGMGGFLAAFHGKFNALILALSILTTLFLQVLSNLANDYGDSIHGADGAQRQGPSRAVQAGVITPVKMKKAIIAFACLSLFSGLVMLFYAFNNNTNWLLFFLLIGILAIVAAIAYTNGKKPYGYIGLGDLSVMIFFGFAAVLGSYFLYSQSIEFELLLPAFSCGFFAVGVLNVNNIRDIESDRLAGKYSIPVRLGRQKAVVYHWILLATGLTCALLFSVLNYKSPLQFLFLLTTPLLVKNGVAVWKESDAKGLDPYLKQLAITTLLFVLLFGIGLLFA